MTTRNEAAANSALDLLDRGNAALRELRSIVQTLSSGRVELTDLLSQAASVEAAITARRDEIQTIIDSNVPAHEWDGTQLRLQNPDGEWGDQVDLVGPVGLNPRGAWTSGPYAPRDVVTMDGAAWIARIATDTPPGGSDWSLLVAAGDPGPPGPHIALRVSSGWIEWRPVGTVDWFQLLQVADLMSEANPDTLAARAEAVEAAATATAARAVVEEIYDTVTAQPVSIAASTYTITADDIGKVLEFTAACVVSFSNNLPAGAFGTIAREGTGEVSWAMLSDATSQAYPSGTKIAGRYGSVTWRVHANSDGAHADYRIQGAIA